ncbi:MAG: hypothetical protein ABIN36_16975, partial [Ferruginibacter sp.]
CLGRTNIGELLVVILYICFSIGSGSGLDVFQIPQHRKALFVVRHPIEHPAHIQSSMTLPTRPHAIFSTFARRTKPMHETDLAKELKMPTHSRPTPADEYLSSFVRHFSNKYLLGTQAHPPPGGRNSYQLCF